MEKATLEKLRGYAASSRSQATFGGSTFLKLDQNDGSWRAGKNNIDMNDRKLGADLPDAMGGFQRLESGQKPIYAVVRILDDVAQPERSDPYQPVTIVPFWDLETRQIFIYSASNAGARDAVAGLLDAYADNCAGHPEDAHKLPIIELKSDSYVNTNGKTIFVPLLDIVGWVERPAAVRHVQPPPLSIEPKPATVESTPTKSSDKPKSTAKPKPKISVPGATVNIDDEIPFAPEWRG